MTNSPTATPPDVIADRLRAGAAILGVPLAPAIASKLIAYLDELVKWNEVHNLTAVRERPQMVTQHLLDSLAVLPHLFGRRIIDVGSGAGFPGIPLALLRPDWQFALLDSSFKKTSFLEHIRDRLHLPNVSVIHGRAEQYRPVELYDVAIARAFADLNEFTRCASHLVHAKGRLAAMKGVYPDEEMAAVVPPFFVAEVIRLQVPELQAHRHLIILERR